MVSSAQGLDVSNFQGRFNWSGTSGLSFGICRATQGLGAGTNSPDPELAWNWAQIHAKQLHRGAYHFLDARLGGAKQADYFVKTLQSHGLATSDMLWLDNETAGDSAASTSAAAVGFMHELDKLCPHNPRGVYTFLDFASTGHCAGLGSYPLWIAHPGASAPAAPAPWTHWTFWQWGLRNGVDADAFNGTPAELDAWIARFQPPPPGTAVQPTHVTGSARYTNATIQWSGAQHVTAYEVYLADDAGNTITKTSVTSSTSTYTFKALHKKTSYKLGILAKPAAPGTGARYVGVTTRA